MPVPKTGKFNQSGSNSNFTIQGAIVEGGNSGDALSLNALIADSNAAKYDEDYAGDITNANTDISSSAQFRGYPTGDRYNFELTCLFNKQTVVPDPDPLPTSSQIIITTDDNGGGDEGYGSFGGSITGSNGTGSAIYPVSSSYTIDSIVCDTDTGRFRYVVDTNGLTGTIDDLLPTFTNVTISSSAGTQIYDFCDIHNSGSAGTGLYFYSWQGSCEDYFPPIGGTLSVVWNTQSADCSPTPVSSTLLTRTQAETTTALACNQFTIENMYMHDSDLADGVTTGDVVFEDSDGLVPFDGNTKYYGLKTSSALENPGIPDVVARIINGGIIVEVIDCNPASAFVYPTHSVEWSCSPNAYQQLYTTDVSTKGETTYKIYNTIIQESSNYQGEVYRAIKLGSSVELSGSFNYEAYTRPNRIQLIEDAGRVRNGYRIPTHTTDWVGIHPGYNTPGQPSWGSSLNRYATGSIPVRWTGSSDRQVIVHYGKYDINNPLGDAAIWDYVCSGSLVPLSVRTGSTKNEACFENTGSVGYTRTHYIHSSNTGSWPTPIPITSYYNRPLGPKVYENEDGSNWVTGSDNMYFSYSSSAGTRYVYQLERLRSVLGHTTEHVVCPGTQIAGIHLTNQGDDCDDTNTSLSNRAYIASSWSGFVLSGGVLKIDNDNITISDQIDQDLYSSNSGSVIHPDSITAAISTVGHTSPNGTFLVSQDSLKNPSGTKILATVDGSTTPSNISFTPCTSPPGGSGCTEFDASRGFYDSSFSGVDPRPSHCSNTLDGALFISMSGLIPSVNDTVHTSAACSGQINAPNTYYTIYNSTMNKTFIIKMNSDSDGIQTVWECSTQTTGSNDYYLSTPFSNQGDNCGQSYAVTNQVTSDAPTVNLGLGYKVFDNGSTFNGNSKYYIVANSSYTDPGDTNLKYWLIDSGGIVQDVVHYNCADNDGVSE